MSPDSLKFIYSILGLMIGLILILTGFVIAILDRPNTKQNSTIQLGKLTMKNPATGLAFAVLGIGVIYLTRFST